MPHCYQSASFGHTPWNGLHKAANVETKQSPPELIPEIQAAIDEIVDYVGKEEAQDLLNNFYHAYLMDASEDGFTKDQVFTHFLLFRNLQKILRYAKGF